MRLLHALLLALKCHIKGLKADLRYAMAVTAYIQDRLIYKAGLYGGIYDNVNVCSKLH